MMIFATLGFLPKPPQIHSDRSPRLRVEAKNALYQCGRSRAKEHRLVLASDSGNQFLFVRVFVSYASACIGKFIRSACARCYKLYLSMALTNICERRFRARAGFGLS